MLFHVQHVVPSASEEKALTFESFFGMEVKASSSPIPRYLTESVPCQPKTHRRVREGRTLSTLGIDILVVLTLRPPILASRRFHHAQTELLQAERRSITTGPPTGGHALYTIGRLPPLTDSSCTTSTSRAEGSTVRWSSTTGQDARVAVDPAKSSTWRSRRSGSGVTVDGGRRRGIGRSHP